MKENIINLDHIKKEKSIHELLEFGIINVDKSSGPTSFNVSDFVKKTLGLRKTSHFGTLDPKVTGVLPVALNRACKLTGYFIGEDKEYVGIMRFHEEVDLKTIEKIISKKFLGNIRQKPPVKSRVKREERTREIKSFEILESDGKDFLFRVNCQGGTYIRKLIDDLGKELRIGAHMLELRRVSAGIFMEDDKSYPSVNLYDIEKAAEEYKKGNEKLLREMIIPAEIISKVYPVILIKVENLNKVFNGQPIYREEIINKINLEKGDVCCVFCENKFIGMYKKVGGKEIALTSQFVMQPIKK
jgi:H/ACA ribonucleoprotein complex subunit 4